MKTQPRFALHLGLLTVAGLIASGASAQDDIKPNAGAARSKIAMCIGCHGIEGYRSSFPEVHRVPKISGQNAKYIASALQAYRQGDRKHPTMHAIASSLTDQDIQDLAAYYEADGKDLPQIPGSHDAASAEIKALLQKGSCESCHGQGFSKPIDGSYPKLAGQYPDYLYVALKAYHTADNPRIGRNNPVMTTQARIFSLPELKQLADYIGSLPSDLKTVPPSKFRVAH